MLWWRLDAFCVYRSFIILCVISLTALCEVLVVDVLQILINRVIRHVVALDVHVGILDILDALCRRVRNNASNRAGVALLVEAVLTFDGKDTIRISYAVLQNALIIY